MLVVFQLVCLVLLPVAYVNQVRLNRETLRLAPLIFIASWIGEATSVYFYGFYSYSEQWWWRVADVPLLVPVIWPLVILSAREVVRALWPNLSGWERKVSRALSLLVLTMTSFPRCPSICRM